MYICVYVCVYIFGWPLARTHRPKNEMVRAELTFALA